MEFHIPTTSEIVEKYSDYNPSLDTEAALEAKRDELHKLTKDELVSQILESQKETRKDTVQDLAKAILRDPELIAANYEQIAEAIRELKPEAKTSSKSIASYVSKKRDEWDLPQRIRVTAQRAPKKVEEPEAETSEDSEV